jgi:antitoxin component YwqK of YwqJK toxin-antitoxin module
MKNAIIPYIIVLTFFVSCTTINHPKWLCNKRIACKRHIVLLEDIKTEMGGFLNNSIKNYKFSDFPIEDSTKYVITLYEDQFVEGGMRYGKIIDGYKEGKWLSGDADFDKSGKVYAKGGIWREEYFKHGLRDSVFRQFNNDSKIIYETTFKMGTGLWKEFHSNGKIYFEIQTKDGYFTDTLKLYNEKGKLKEKLLYKKDSLVYRKNFIIDDNPSDNKK